MEKYVRNGKFKTSTDPTEQYIGICIPTFWPTKEG